MDEPNIRVYFECQGQRHVATSYSEAIIKDNEVAAKDIIYMDIKNYLQHANIPLPQYITDVEARQDDAVVKVESFYVL